MFKLMLKTANRYNFSGNINFVQSFLSKFYLTEYLSEISQDIFDINELLQRKIALN